MKNTLSLVEEIREKKIEDLVYEILDKHSYWFDNRNCYSTHYFWIKDYENFSCVWDEDLNKFTEKVRKNARHLLSMSNSV